MIAMGNIRKTLKYGTNAIILIVAVVTIAILLNVAVVMYDFKFDMTPGQIFSITSVSKNIVNEIPASQKLEIYGLFDSTKKMKELDYNSWMELLRVYEQEAKGKISVFYKDPVENPKLYSDLGYSPETQDAKNPAVFIFKSGVKSKIIFLNDLYVALQNENQENVGRQINSEQIFTGAIKYVSTNMTPKIYFSQGNKEISPQNGFTKLALSLQNNNYALDTINLLSVKAIPNDCKVLFLLSPAIDLTSNEQDMIFKYLRNGGSAVFAFDGAFNKRLTYDNIQSLLDNYGISIKNDVVTETDARFILTDPKDSFVAGTTAVTINLGFEGQPVQIINARSLDLSTHKVDGVENSALISTSPFAQSTNIVTGESQKAIQNLLIGASRTAENHTSKIIALGSSGFLSDKVSSAFFERNSRYFLNLINWLSNIEDDNIVSSKQIDNYTFKIEKGPGELLLLLTIIVLPLVIFAIGLWIFTRRRHL